MTSFLQVQSHLLCAGLVEYYDHVVTYMYMYIVCSKVDRFISNNEGALTALRPTLTGIHPDDAFSIVPYEKGSAFLFHLETLLGGPGSSLSPLSPPPLSIFHHHGIIYHLSLSLSTPPPPPFASFLPIPFLPPPPPPQVLWMSF